MEPRRPHQKETVLYRLALLYCFSLSQYDCRQSSGTLHGTRIIARAPWQSLLPRHFSPPPPLPPPSTEGGLLGEGEAETDTWFQMVEELEPKPTFR